MFDGAEITLMIYAASISETKFHYKISPQIKLTDDESRGITLVKTPIDEISGILEYNTEYYIRDIYGNEVVLTMNDDTPVLYNIANAKITDDSVNYGEKTLREGNPI